MRLVADVHGATAALARVAAMGGPLLILGDLINFIDYRTNEGIVTDVSGKEFTDEMVRLRTAGESAAAARLWRSFSAGREQELRARYDRLIEDAYVEICAALEHVETAYVTFGNVDRPDLLRKHLPGPARFVDGEVVEIEGARVGFAGGGIVSIGTAGEVTEADMAAKLDRLGPVDILCTHVPPSIPALATDVVAGRTKGSGAVLDYLDRHRPPYHYFGDVHQGRATSWRHGPTYCVNVGYFRATGRAIHHG